MVIDGLCGMKLIEERRKEQKEKESKFMHGSHLEAPMVSRV